MKSTTAIRLLGMSGSLRRFSANTALLEAVRSKLAARGDVTLTIFSLADLPLFNTDLEGDNPPPRVRALQEALLASDGLVLSSPEYNHGMSGVLKNALDWASRPPDHSPLKGLPALIMTAAPGMCGGARATQQIREALASCFARVVPRKDVVISKVYDKMVDGKFVDEATLNQVLQAIDDLIAEIMLVRSSRMQPARRARESG